MQTQYAIWATIGGYILLVLTLSSITTLWIRHHLKKPKQYPQCELKNSIYTLSLFKELEFRHCLYLNKQSVYKIFYKNS